MLIALIRKLIRGLLALRYRIRTKGLDAIAARGTGGILFLPNHPALIDPVIVYTTLHQRFRPRALADRDQTQRSIMKWVSRQIGTIPIPDIKIHGAAVLDEVSAAKQECASTLQSGGNILLYPSGHIYRTRHEDLRGNSGVEELLRVAPDARIVMVRTTGLWGSRTGLARGEFPNLGRLLWWALWNIIRNGVFFIPKRDVLLEFVEPAEFPRAGSRQEINAYLESFYNADPPPARGVAEFWASKPRVYELPDPDWGRTKADVSDVPDGIRERVYAVLREVTDETTFEPTQRLSQDLGLDSLAKIELLLKLQREFGHEPPEAEAIDSVGDVLVAACGEAIVTRPTTVNRPPAAWERPRGGHRVPPPAEDTIPAAFLAAARRNPDAAIAAENVGGVKTYRNLITAVFVLKPLIAQLEGDCVGIMLPASTGAATMLLAAQFAGKSPVMVNWTTGARNIAHTLELTGVRHVLTSQRLVERLESRGTDLGAIRDKLLMVESLRDKITRWRKLTAFVRSYVSWRALRRARVSPIAAILATSGSESLPKAVPLSHKNILANLRDMLGVVDIRTSDRLIAFLPPFHSFGLTATTVLPLVSGVRVVFHPDPTEARTISKLVGMYNATIVIGTPTFIHGLLRATRDDAQLKSLRLAVTGAEKCPERLYDMLAERLPHLTALEGYGITECSPVVAVNRPEQPKRGTIGKVLPSLDYVLLHPETNERVPRGQVGVLHVCGPSIFDGYLGDPPSPFVTHDDRAWYRTGDLVREDDDGVLEFRGRLKRFVKIGGEMVSLPAIESVLLERFGEESDEGPALAVTATESDRRPEIVLCTTRPFERKAANEALRAAGLSPLHGIGRVELVNEIPLLGTGKVDYRTLDTQLAERAKSPATTA